MNEIRKEPFVAITSYLAEPEPARKAVAEKAPAEKAVKAVAEKVPAEKAVKAVAEKLPAEKAVKAVAEKVPAEKAPAEKAVKAVAEKVIGEYLQGNQDTEVATPVANTNSYDVEKKIAEKKGEQAAQVEAKMTELVENMLQYYCNNGASLKGFKNTGFPNGVSDLKIKTDVGYGNTDNDEFEIGDDGAMSVARVPDDLLITITYQYNGASHTVTAKAAYPWEKTLGGQEAEFLGYYGDDPANTEEPVPDPTNNFGL